MTGIKGARAAHALVTGRAYGGDVRKEQLNIRIDPRLLALAEQYHICARKGTGGIQSAGDWITDRLIEAIREKRDFKKERDDVLLSGYDRMNEAVLFGGVPESGNG